MTIRASLSNFDRRAIDSENKPVVAVAELRITTDTNTHKFSLSTGNSPLSIVFIQA
jgi:hypothetical protein